MRWLARMQDSDQEVDVLILRVLRGSRPPLKARDIAALVSRHVGRAVSTTDVNSRLYGALSQHVAKDANHHWSAKGEASVSGKSEGCSLTGVDTSPICPASGAPMALRTARRGQNTGGQFYGCSKYPECKATRAIDGSLSPEDGSSSERESEKGTPPICPSCGVQVVLRTARHSPNAGGRFYGCPNDPACKGILSVDDDAEGADSERVRSAAGNADIPRRVPAHPARIGTRTMLLECTALPREFVAEVSGDGVSVATATTNTPRTGYGPSFWHRCSRRTAAFLGNRGHCLLDNGRAKEAFDTYAAARKLAPRDPAYSSWMRQAEARLRPPGYAADRPPRRGPGTYQHDPWAEIGRINAINRANMQRMAPQLPAMPSTYQPYQPPVPGQQPR